MRVSHFHWEHERDAFILYIWGGKWFKHSPTLCVEVWIQYFLDEHIIFTYDTVKYYYAEF